MKLPFFMLSLAVVCAPAQLPPPSLAEIKVAAEAGDPAAQDKLAEKFILRADTEQAEVWYRKAAAQGFAHAQGRLGNMLLGRSRTWVSASSATRAAIGEEAVKWITLAAGQGDKRGQADLADICLEGKLVKQDLVEAYKWGELAAQGSMIDPAAISGQSTRDTAILKMSAEQIAEAKRRAGAFVPHQLTKSEIPEPAWVKQIKLQGISGTAARRLALINNQTFQQGEESKIKIGERAVKVRCVAMRESSVVVSIEGIEGERELKLK